MSPSANVDGSLSDVATLEESINLAISAGSSLNTLLDLLSLTRDASQSVQKHKGIWALYRVYGKLIQAGRLFGSISSSSPEHIDSFNRVKQWLSQQFDAYCRLLAESLWDQESQIRISTIQILMDLLKQTSSAISKGDHPQLYMKLWRNIILGLTMRPSDMHGARNAVGNLISMDVFTHFMDTWLNNFDDIRWFMLRGLSTLLDSPSSDASLIANSLSFLEGLKHVPAESSKITSFWIPEFTHLPKTGMVADELNLEDMDEASNDDWRDAFRDNVDDSLGVRSGQRTRRTHRLSTLFSIHSVASHRSHFTTCWFLLLQKMPKSEKNASRVLTILEKGVIPHLTRPTNLHDWVAGCVQYGGPVGLLALNSLFVLMQRHNLDYPLFYNQLYSFLDRNLLHVKYRSRFFRLTELFLASSHLPATMIASFVKRLSRLSLSAQPAALAIVIPFIYNLMRKHPALMVMIHRTNDLSASLDPFDMEEPDPYVTQALHSSLWEIVSHSHHYNPNIALMARVFENKFTKQQYLLEDFLDHTYSTMFASEVNRRLPEKIAVSGELGYDLFPVNASRDPDPSTQGDLINDIWTFG